MNKQLELDFSCIKDLRDDVKNQIKENIEKGNYTLDQLNSIYRHIYVHLQKDLLLFVRNLFHFLLSHFLLILLFICSFFITDNLKKRTSRSSIILSNSA